MIIASGITNSAVSIVVGLFLIIAFGFHCLMIRLVYSGVLKKIQGMVKYRLIYWFIHFALLALSCGLLYTFLYLKYFLTGRGLFS